MKRLALTLILAGFAFTASAADFQIVVNSSNPLTSISKATVRDFFLGRSTRWPDGSSVKPLDLPESSNVRAQFSKQALGKEVGAVKSHWLTIVFAGRGTPPVQLDSDEKVLSTVRANRQAIGYVTAGTALGAGVKPLPMTD